LKGTPLRPLKAKIDFNTAATHDIIAAAPNSSKTKDFAHYLKPHFGRSPTG